MRKARSVGADSVMSGNRVTSIAGLLFKDPSTLSYQLRIFILSGELLLFPNIEKGNIGFCVPLGGKALLGSIMGGELRLRSFNGIYVSDFNGAS